MEQYDVKAQLQDTNNPNMGIIDGDVETFTTTNNEAPIDGTYDNAPTVLVKNTTEQYTFSGAGLS